MSTQHKYRPMREAYVDGFVRDVYLDTGEVVECQRPHKAIYRFPTGRGLTGKNKEVLVSSLRSKVYERDNGCVVCGTSSHLTLHHVVHRSMGGRNEMSNLQALCWPHHAAVHQKLRLPSGTLVNSSMLD